MGSRAPASLELESLARPRAAHGVQAGLDAATALGEAAAEHRVLLGPVADGHQVRTRPPLAMSSTAICSAADRIVGGTISAATWIGIVRVRPAIAEASTSGAGR